MNGTILVALAAVGKSGRDRFLLCRLGAGQTHGKRLLHQARGQSELRCDEATLRLLWARQVTLVQALLSRGHASMEPIRMNLRTDDRSLPPSAPRRLPIQLDEARIRPQWSRMAANADPVAIASPSRRSVQDNLAMVIAQMLH